MKRAPDNVRYLGQFGEHILKRSFTARDPQPTLWGAPHWVSGHFLGRAQPGSLDPECSDLRYEGDRQIVKRAPGNVRYLG